MAQNMKAILNLAMPLEEEDWFIQMERSMKDSGT
jgi:hypothetical protein